MAVAHVVSSASHASGSFSVSQASFSWTHTTSTDPQGVLVFVFQGVASTDAVTSVTYDGVTVPAVTGGRAVDTATELGATAAYFLGSGVPATNNPTVVVNRTNNTTTMWAVAVTVTAAADTEVAGVVLLQENGTYAVQSVDDGSTTDSVRYAGAYYGGASPAPAGTGSTLLHSDDAGAYGWSAVRETTAGQGARNVGFTQATSDDRAGVHLAVREVVPPVTGQAVGLFGFTGEASGTAGGGMAFTVTARQSGTNDGTAATNLTTGSATPTASSLFVVAYGAQMDAFGTVNLPEMGDPTGGSLTYTLIERDGDTTGSAYLWADTNGFWVAGACYRATIGASPSAFAVTVDPDATANTFASAVCFDITGHNTSTPIVQQAATGANINPASSAAAGSVTLGAAPTAGNLIVVAFFCGVDAAGGVTSPTAGAGNTFTALSNNQSAAFCASSVFTRVADGDESATISTTDLGQSVGNYVAVAFEVAAASSGVTGTAAGLFGFTSPAQGVDRAVGAALGSFGFTATASGTVGAPPVTGIAAGAFGFTATASGVPRVVGAAITAFGYSSTVTGVSRTLGVAAAVLGFTATASGSAHRYVAGVSSNGRYFVDQAGDPILIRGESPWAMFTDLSSSEMDTYLGNRASYGCNLALVSMIGSVANGGPADTGATYDSVLPFVGGDITVFNSTYWSRMDSYIAKARDLGITLMIYPMDGWNCTFSGTVFDPGDVSNAECETYGNTLATRYLSYPNIVWAFGGDYNEDATINARFNACLTGIRAAGDTRPASIQLLYETSESHNSSFWETKVDWDWVYTYYVTYKGTSDAYNYTWSQAPTVRPALFSEGAYENSGAPHPGTDTVIRRQACWALTSGSPGELTGQEDVWDFQSGWASLLDTTAADQLKAIRDTFDALSWWKLVPDDANQLVTAGRGTRVTTDSATFPADNNYVTAAKAADGTLAVIYLPNAASAITVDMGEMGANPTATWVDPTTGGTFSETPDGSYSRGNNAAAATDWLLILTGDTLAVTGTATGSFGFTGTAQGIDRAVGAAVATLGFTGAALGVDRSVGSSLAAFGFLAAAAGVPEVFAVAAAVLGFTGSAQGFAGTPPVTGTGSGAFGFAAAAQGQPRATGTASGAFGFTATGQGSRRVVAAAVSSYGFVATVLAVSTTRGTAASTFGFTGAASGATVQQITPRPNTGTTTRPFTGTTSRP